MYEIIHHYQPQDSFEMKDKEQFEEAIRLFGESLFDRHPMMHFTASSIIFNQTFDKILMIYHKMYNSWSWTGGHLDGNQSFLDVALIEAKEETGLTNIKVLDEKPISLESLPVWFHIKKGKPISSHLHLNLSFAFVADENEPLILNEEETSGVKWIDILQYKKYVTEPDMYPIYDKIINRVKKND